MRPADVAHAEAEQNADVGEVRSSRVEKGRTKFARGDHRHERYSSFAACLLKSHSWRDRSSRERASLVSLRTSA
jgi:hypothetical protein